MYTYVANTWFHMRNIQFVEDIYQRFAVFIKLLIVHELKDHNAHPFKMWFVKTIYLMSSRTVFEKITPR
jgi:hypothetical protein